MSSHRIDVQMKLLSGQTMYVEDIPIKPFSLGEVSSLGYSFFQGNVNVLLLTIDDMIDSIDDFEMSSMLKANKHQYKVFDMYSANEDMSEVLVSSLKMIFRTDEVHLRADEDGNKKVVIDEKYEIVRDNFDEVVKVIEVQNNPDFSSSVDDYNPANDVARDIADKIKKGKEKANKSKAMESGGEGINLPDVISAVSAMSNSINKLNIWDLTIYQLYDEFARINKIDSYRLQIQASMWSSDVEIEHWSDPL